MGILKNRYRIRNETVGLSLNDPDIFKILGIDPNSITKSKFGETVYFICLNHLIQTSAKMYRYVYQDTMEKGKEKLKDSLLNYTLNREPNPVYTASTLWASTELNRLHYGNAYIYIENQGKSTYLWLLPSNEVDIYIDNIGLFDTAANGKAKSILNPIWYVWNDSRSGKRYTFNSNEIMHFKTHISEDGLSGLSVREILKTQIDSLKYSENFQGNLFKNNMFGGKVILQYTGDLSPTLKDTLVTETERYANSVGSGKFLPIPLGITATPLDMKLTDADFVELNKLSALQLAACFGIKPNVLNNYDKSSYSNSETQQLDFYVNSLQPIFKMYNDETTKKLISTTDKGKGIFVEIDKESLFELDKKTKLEIVKDAVNNFLMTPNEGREELGKPYYDDENANKLYGNGNLIELSKAGQGANYMKGVSK